AFVPLLGYSVAIVKYQKRYQLHKSLQLTLGTALLIVVVLFETDMRMYGWRERAATSPYAGHEGSTDWVVVALAVHLCFAVSTALLWIVVTALALRRFPDPPRPAAHSMWHRRAGKLAAYDMLGTAITGWIFYWLAFVA